LALVLIVAGCQRDGGDAADPGVGTLKLTAEISGELVIDAVNYRLTGNGMAPREGSVDLSQPGGKLAVLLNGVPAGLGYLVTLEAVTRDGLTTCRGQASVDILAGRISQIHLVLHCRTANWSGGVVITGGFNRCPEIESYSVSPLAVSVGGTMILQASATDRDPSDVVRYSWTGQAGPFSAPEASMTLLECQQVGVHNIELVVGDGGCTASTSFQVTCLGADAGVADAGADTSAADSDPPEVPVTCNVSGLDQLDGASFLLSGTETITKQSRVSGPFPPGDRCQSASAAFPVQTRAQLRQYAGGWYLWYEGPYAPVNIPNGTLNPAIAATTMVPHQPFVDSTDPQRQGVPLALLSSPGDDRIRFVAAPEAKIPRQTASGYEVPLCTDYTFTQLNNVFEEDASGLELEISPASGAVQLLHRCAVHHLASGCLNPATLSDVLVGSGDLCAAD
jgi:hypothetical protein